MKRQIELCLALAVWVGAAVAWPGLASGAAAAEAPEIEDRLAQALQRAGQNRDQLRRALDGAPEMQRHAVRFLIAYMPERDLQSLDGAYILKNVDLAFQARSRVRWGPLIPEERFLNDVVPYASLNERRDDWREDFMGRFLPLVQDAATPAEAAQILNRDMFRILNVRYHASKRPKPDQSPHESMAAQYASCSGLSILLIDACRAVCVPARFAGTPQWTTKRGNHSWVEIWDGAAWTFTGACEYNVEGLGKTWFQGDAAKALKDDPRHAIYASSWRHTGTSFPLVWDRSIEYVAAENVTDAYTSQSSRPLPGTDETTVGVELWRRRGGERIAAGVVILDGDRVAQEGQTKGPGDDANHRLEVLLRKDHPYQVRYPDAGGGMRTVAFRTSKAGEQQIDLYQADDRVAPVSPVDALRGYLGTARSKRPVLADQEFASTPLSRAEVAEAGRLLREDTAAWLRETRRSEMEARTLTNGNHLLRFDYQVFGERPASGRSLFISMHGGGGAPKEVNDRQWENQKKLYAPPEGVYVAPRAPTDTWDLWHQAHIDGLFDRLIEDMVVFEDVNPNRIYLMGYSAGGDGVFQLAPRMADRWAAAAMMAGHPNETSPLGLRNIGFTLHMGELDAAYKRNAVAAEWKAKLAGLQAEDPEGYRHVVVIHPGKGHWMDKQDAVAIPWMMEFTRQPYPRRLVWKQDDVTHARFYWLEIRSGPAKAGSLVRAQVEGQTVEIWTDEAAAYAVYLNDDMVDLERPVMVKVNGTARFAGRVDRTIGALARSGAGRFDPGVEYSARVQLAEGAGGGSGSATEVAPVHQTKINN